MTEMAIAFFLNTQFLLWLSIFGISTKLVVIKILGEK